MSSAPDDGAAVAGAFSKVETWIFDLDNTLYPPRSNLFAQVDQKMGAFISRLLDVDLQEAKRLQKGYYRQYGTTLRGLMSEHGVDPHDFLAFVHDIDHSPIEPDPALGAALSLLPGRKFVLTNGSRRHAESIVARLGIEDHFEDLFDIIAAEFEPKPARPPYDRFLARYDVDPTRSAMFEDLPRNLDVPHELGMRTVLVVAPPDTPQETVAYRQQWEIEIGDAASIDHVTDDLADFLVSVSEDLGSTPSPTD
ncbi:pyrimidine 5'-nucleotidase [Microbaculum marinum]|uniref:Pyrimidine 5'-nucleotidase n=1 Tax=Microbaculum marinum TaxID=1764581 RepID=A0AAW9RPT6_9HYPH